MIRRQFFARHCAALCGGHLLALAISTYVAAIDIETILFSGAVCSLTGFIAGISALTRQKKILATAAFLTPLIALVLLLLEAIVLQLGPGRAARPFCLIFIANQAISTLVILVALNAMQSPKGEISRRTTLRTLLLATAGFAVFFAISRELLKLNHNWLMTTALGLLGLTCVGLSRAAYDAFSNRQTA